MVRPSVLSASAILCITSASAGQAGKPARTANRPVAIYESTSDPPGEKRSRALIDDGILHFGGADWPVSDLMNSDIGYTLVFEKVMGGIRARNSAILFPDAGSVRFEFDDYSCSVTHKKPSQAVSCTLRSDGRILQSIINSGGLFEFDDSCFYSARICHYRLIAGQALTPDKMPPN